MTEQELKHPQFQTNQKIYRHELQLGEFLQSLVELQEEKTVLL